LLLNFSSFKIDPYLFTFKFGFHLSATDISKAILEVTQSGKMTQLENDMLSSNNCSGSADHQNDIPELGPEPFYNLFCISGGISTVALLITIVRLMRKCQLNMQFIIFLTRIYVRFQSPCRRSTSVTPKEKYPAADPEVLLCVMFRTSPISV